jgi:restriction system protein
MARRKKSSLTPTSVIAAVAVGILLSKALDTLPGVDVIMAQLPAIAAEVLDLLRFLAIVLMIYAGVRLALTLARKRRVTVSVDDVVSKHLDALSRRRAMLIRTDAYGKQFTDKWEAEIRHFIKHHVRPTLSSSLAARLDADVENQAERIGRLVARHVQTKPATKQLEPDTTPEEFEFLCAAALAEAGWNAQATSFSHDQGVDVVAEKEGIRVVLQCKLYSKPVGNGAVQEVAAGKAHQNAHFAAVVTNTSYTQAAEDLARSNGVLLLHFSDLSRLEELLSSTTA